MEKSVNEYAEAMFALACEEGRCDEYVACLTEINGLISHEAEYTAFLDSPCIPKDERTAAIREAFDSYPHTVVDFICLMCERGRIREFSDCVSRIEALNRERKNIKTVTVKSAVPLTDSQKERLCTALEKKYACAVIAEYVIDGTLIGGVRTELDGDVTDGSMRERINRIKDVISK